MLNHWFTIPNHRFTIPNHWFTTLNHWFTIIPPCGTKLEYQLSFDTLVSRHGLPVFRDWSEARCIIKQYVRFLRARVHNTYKLNTKISHPSYPSYTRVRCRMGRMGGMFSDLSSTMRAYARANETNRKVTKYSSKKWKRGINSEKCRNFALKLQRNGCLK